MKSAIFISSGVGNALLLTPLIKALRAQGKVTAISTSPFRAENIFNGYEEDLFAETIVLDSTFEWLKHPKIFARSFDEVHLDYFASTRKHLTFAQMIGKKVITNKIPHNFPSILSRKIHYLEPILGIHETTQYMRFVDEGFKDKNLNEELFELTAKPNTHKIDGPYGIIQPGSGNNQAPWKTWPASSWKELIQKLQKDYPLMTWVICGDENEVELINAFPTKDRVLNLIGQTALDELPGLISGSEILIANDSAMLHIAGTLGVKTVTIWGGSDPQLYGWSKVAPLKHKEVFVELDCQPCNRWIKPNHSKVELPSLCPDFECLHSIQPEMVRRAVVSLLHD